MLPTAAKIKHLTSPKGSCMTVAAGTVTSRISAYPCNVGNNRKTVNFPWLVNPFSHTGADFWESVSVFTCGNKNEYLLSANHRQALD